MYTSHPPCCQQDWDRNFAQRRASRTLLILKPYTADKMEGGGVPIPEVWPRCNLNWENELYAHDHEDLRMLSLLAKTAFLVDRIYFLIF